MTKAFHRLFKYKKIAKNLIGFMRNIEVTVNPDTEFYNQHMHVLLCVENFILKIRKIMLLKKNGLNFGRKR